MPTHSGDVDISGTCGADIQLTVDEGGFAKIDFLNEITTEPNSYASIRIFNKNGSNYESRGSIYFATDGTTERTKIRFRTYDGSNTSTAMLIDSYQNVQVGKGVTSGELTSGFLYIPTTIDTPDTTPDNEKINNCVPMCYQSHDGAGAGYSGCLWFYDDSYDSNTGAWIPIEPSPGMLPQKKRS